MGKRLVGGAMAVAMALAIGACNKKEGGGLGGINLPQGQVPSISAPTFSAPNVPSPTFSTPSIDSPSIADPSIASPSIPSMTAPQPSVPGYDPPAGGGDDATVAPEIATAGVVPPSAKLTSSNHTYRSSMSVAQSFDVPGGLAAVKSHLESKGWSVDSSMPSSSSGSTWMRNGEKSLVLSEDVGGRGGVRVQFFLR